MRSNRDHLVVLCHGILGRSNDLIFLSQNLENLGCSVLKSSSNELLKSFNGIESGGKSLSLEIVEFLVVNPNMKKISFVGNSLGGLYARNAIKELFNPITGLIAGLTPFRFLTIATPHLGVHNHLFLEEFFSLQFPSILKEAVAYTLNSTGRQLFGFDEDNSSDVKRNFYEFFNSSANDNSTRAKNTTLLYRMSTEEQYLKPLKSFKQRRLFANLNSDFVVPLGTSALLSKTRVSHFRAKYAETYGVVETILPNSTSTDVNDDVVASITEGVNGGDDESTMETMRVSLDSCGWEKVIVHFRPTLIPLAHNQIAAVSKFTDQIDAWLGFQEGRYLMIEAAEWLAATAEDDSDIDNKFCGKA